MSSNPTELAPENLALGDLLADATRAYDAHMSRSEEAPRALDDVARDLLLARAILVVARRSLEQVEALDRRAGGLFEEWITALPFDLVEHAMPNDALALATELHEVFGDSFEATGALTPAILARTGRADEARVALEAAVARAPRDAALLDDAADVFEDLGALERARGLWMQLIELAEEPFAAEARAHLERTRPPPVTVAARPGRNDPCSCGSGKKFKKCCG